MPESSTRTPLLNLLKKRFAGQELAPPRRSLGELSDVAERLVPFTSSSPNRSAAPQ